MEIKQLILDLPYRQTFDRQGFVVSPCNSMAVLWIDRYPNWGSHALLIYGPKGCGKTHLSHMFATQHLDATELSEHEWPEADKLVVENIDKHEPCEVPQALVKKGGVVVIGGAAVF